MTTRTCTQATRFGLAHLLILGRPLELLHAHSAREALELLQREGDIAVILLDVVMESDDAGLRTVGVIREQLKMLNTRIILRTGQPGQAPEADTHRTLRHQRLQDQERADAEQAVHHPHGCHSFVRQLLRLDANRRGWKKSSLPATSSLPKRACARCRRRHHADCQPDRSGPGGCGLRGLGRIHQPPPAR